MCFSALTKGQDNRLTEAAVRGDGKNEPNQRIMTNDLQRAYSSPKKSLYTQYILAFCQSWAFNKSNKSNHNLIDVDFSSTCIQLITIYSLSFSYFSTFFSDRSPSLSTCLLFLFLTVCSVAVDHVWNPLFHFHLRICLITISKFIPPPNLILFFRSVSLAGNLFTRCGVLSIYIVCVSIHSVCERLCAILSLSFAFNTQIII